MLPFSPDADAVSFEAEVAVDVVADWDALEVDAAADDDDAASVFLFPQPARAAASDMEKTIGARGIIGALYTFASSSSLIRLTQSSTTLHAKKATDGPSGHVRKASFARANG